MEENKIKGFLDKELVSNSVDNEESKAPEVEAYKPMDNEGGVILPETVQQGSDLPSPLLVVEEKKIKVYLDKKAIGSSFSLDELQGHEAKTHKSMDIEGGVVLP